MSVVNVKVANLRAGCPCCGKKFRTLKKWLEVPEHVYVGRRMVYIEGTFNSPFRNPYFINSKMTREDVVEKFRRMIMADESLKAKVREELSGKTLGCWCAPQKCHAHVLLEILSNE